MTSRKQVSKSCRQHILPFAVQRIRCCQNLSPNNLFMLAAVLSTLLRFLEFGCALPSALGGLASRFGVCRWYGILFGWRLQVWGCLCVRWCRRCCRSGFGFFAVSSALQDQLLPYWLPCAVGVLVFCFVSLDTGGAVAMIRAVTIRTGAMWSLRRHN
jgi:hypothetical protein